MHFDLPHINLDSIGVLADTMLHTDDVMVTQEQLSGNQCTVQELAEAHCRDYRTYSWMVKCLFGPVQVSVAVHKWT